MPEQRTWEQQQEEHAMSNAEVDLAKCRSEHAALLEFYRAMTAWMPYSPIPDKRLNDAYEHCKELGL